MFIKPAKFHCNLLKIEEAVCWMNFVKPTDHMVPPIYLLQILFAGT